MIVSETAERLVTPDDLATSLWNATPQEFHAFWLKFSELSKGDCTTPTGDYQEGSERIEEFGAALVTAGNPEFGSAGRSVLRRLADIADHHAYMEYRLKKARSNRRD